MKQYDYLIVGSGLFGATFAYRASKKGKRCLVIDKRLHLGGNIYSENKFGINVHTYGAHIFHTSNEGVWNFVNSLVPFNRFVNSPLAYYKGECYNLPFNMNTFHQMWGIVTPDEAKAMIDKQRQAFSDSIRGREPENLEEQALTLVGKDIYEKLIKGYTEKQWGRTCRELPAFIIRRLPVRFVYDNNYFNDTYQGIPIGGYNKLIDVLLNEVEIKTGVDYFENKAYWNSLAEKIVFTGKIDEYYDYCYGKLQYRTVRFEEEIIEKSNFQGCAVVNYTDSEIPYTRIIEHKHFESFGQNIYEIPLTIISREYSVEWKDGMEPYYPINDLRNQTLYAKYQELSQQEQNVIMGGRLAEYKYYDMAPIIEKVLSMPV
jgi:UDP-galactopyranose mutase